MEYSCKYCAVKFNTAQKPKFCPYCGNLLEADLRRISDDVRFWVDKGFCVDDAVMIVNAMART